VVKLHFDPGRTGVEGIFHEFLHDRSRTLNHLAGGDLIGNTIRQDADLGHGFKQSSQKPAGTEARIFDFRNLGQAIAKSRKR
jgi:hypothetical protein